MKISFSGVQCTGKTTLINALSENESFKDFEIIKESIRKLHKQGVKINENGDDSTQLRVMLSHLINLKYDDAILDRCLLDGMVYTHWLYEKNKISKDTYDLCFDVFNQYIKNYDIIFYLVPEFDLISDGTRSMDINFRDETKKIFDMYVEYLLTKQIKIITLHGSVEDRLKTIIDETNKIRKLL